MFLQTPQPSSMEEMMEAKDFLEVGQISLYLILEIVLKLLPQTNLLSVAETLALTMFLVVFKVEIQLWI